MNAVGVHAVANGIFIEESRPMLTTAASHAKETLKRVVCAKELREGGPWVTMERVVEATRAPIGSCTAAAATTTVAS